MFQQIKYAFLDIKMSKRISIIFLLQMIVVFLLIDSSILSIITVNKGIERLRKMEESRAYINRDSTSNFKINSLMANEKSSVKKMKELYKYILNNNKTYTYSELEFNTNKKLNGHDIIEATSNKMFFDMYGINVIEGSMFNTSDFVNNSTVIPIVIGYNLKDIYKLNKIYHEVDCATSKQVTYKVIGILEYNSSYPSLVDIGQTVNLNTTFFRPININRINDFASLDMAINSTVVLTNNPYKIRTIENKSADLDLFSMNYKPIQQCIEDYLEIFKKKIIYKLFIGIIILLFSMISMALNIMTMIAKNTREFSIHLICGGTINSILQRIVWRLLIILLLALIPSIVVYGINISFVYTALIGLFIGVLTMILPYIKITRTNIIQLVRRSE